MPALTALASIALRVAVIYVALLVLLRLSGRRELSELSPMDLLTMLLVSETVSPAMTGGDSSLPGGLVAAATLFLLSLGSSMVAFHSRRAEKVLEGASSVLIKNGKLDDDVRRRELVTNDALRSALHQHGVLSVADVAFAFIESDGEITMIKKQELAETREARRRAVAAQPS
jgi:uncharacterized membrane protein YcaP (DUF421 family)